jgi:hypothetical protein
MAPVENDVSHIFKSDNTVGTPYLCVEGRLQKMKTGKAEVWPEGMGMEIFGEYQKFETKLKSDELVSLGYYRNNYDGGYKVTKCVGVTAYIPKKNRKYESYFVIRDEDGNKLKNTLPPKAYCSIEIYDVTNGEKSLVTPQKSPYGNLCKK